MKHETPTPPVLPTAGFLRLPQVQQFFPVAKTTWWEGVRKGRYPKPVKLGPNTTAWRVEDIRELIKKTIATQAEG